MRTTTVLASIATLLLLAHRAQAFDIYLMRNSDCPEEEDIDVVCKDTDVGRCCNGHVGVLYSSATATDDKEGVVLYALNQGQPADSPNRCGLQIARDDACATVDIPMGSAAGVLGRSEEEEDDSSESERRRRHARDVTPPKEATPEKEEEEEAAPKKETWIEKNKKVKRDASGWIQQQFTSYAVRSKTHIYKLSRDSEHAPAFEALTDRKERVEFVKRHGVAQRR